MTRPTSIAVRGAQAVLLCLFLLACSSTPPPPTFVTPVPTGGPSATTTIVPGSSPAATVAPGASVEPSIDPSPAASPDPSGSPTMPTPDELAAQLAVPGTLTVCLALLGEPAAVLDDLGEPDGYNPAFARELALRMGLTPDIQPTVFGELTGQIQAHACDVSVSSQNITPSRLAAMAMTPYTRSVQPVLVYKGNPLGILELEDLCGRTVSAASGSTHVDFVNGTGDFEGEGLNEACAEAGSEPVEVVTFATEAEAVEALVADEVNAYLGNPNFYYDFVDDLDFSGAALPAAEQGIATALDRPLLTTAVDVALEEMILDGTYDSILRQYLLTEENAQAVSIIE